MKQRVWWIAFLLLTTISFTSTTFAQGMRGRWSLGLGAGGQQLLGDSGAKVDKFGFGADGSLGYRFSNHFGLVLTGGYGELPFSIGSPLGDIDFATKFFFGDLKLDLELLKGGFRPYLTAGAGVFNFVVTTGGAKSERFSDGAFLGGAGFRLGLGSKASLDFGANYKYSTGDDLDGGIKAGSNDAFVTVRGGLTLHMGQPRAAQPVALEEAPVESAPPDEVDALRSRLDSMEQQTNAPDQSEQSMEEYVRMKSKIDELNQQIDAKETEIASLRQTIDDKKKTIGQMETALQAPPVTNSNLGGFSKAYEEALNKYYAKQYTPAIRGFEALLNNYPTHSLASNCQYWIGESYFAASDFPRAADAFTAVLSFQNSLKRDDALIMLGKTYLKLGDNAKARESLDRLVRDFPNSEFVAKAEQLLKKI